MNMLKKIYYKLAMMAFRKDAKANMESRPIHGEAKPLENFYALGFKTLEGKEKSLEEFRGKYLLITNTASACGFTPQYKELQALKEKYSNKLEVIGFPADNFGSQEPLANEEIGAFCEKNYGVKFTLAAKSDVIGHGKNEVFKWLSTSQKNGWNNKEPKWNFSKYLVSPEGNLLGFYPSGVSPFSEEITKFL